MKQSLFLIDGMALAYRAHFAFANRPILTSAGDNTSAIFGFTQATLEILEKRSPTHIAIAFDTSAPTFRHTLYPEYKAGRDEMPEDLRWAIPNIARVADALSIPVLTLDGYEADDIIGALAQRAAASGLEVVMVTPDKDFAQLVTDQVSLYRPARFGGAPEILGPEEVKEKWSIERPSQFIDILALWGDSSDNIPGAPGIGEKTAIKLVERFGSIENLIDHVDDLKGKQREKIEDNADSIRLSKRLATIDTNTPIDVPIDALSRKPFDENAVRSLCIEFEFNAIGKRLLGDDFVAGRGATARVESSSDSDEPHLLVADVQRYDDSKQTYQLLQSPEEISEFLKEIQDADKFCFDTETTGLNPRDAELVGISLAARPGHAAFIYISEDPAERDRVLDLLRPVFTDASKPKIAHNIKYDLAILEKHNIVVAGALMDTMVASGLLQPEGRHGMDYLAETHLNYAPIPFSDLVEAKKGESVDLRAAPLDKLRVYAAEDADITLRLADKLFPLLKKDNLWDVYWQVEEPVIRALLGMETAGIRLDPAILKKIGHRLDREIDRLRISIYEKAGKEFNLNSPKQLGVVLFEDLRLVDKPKKTKTNQYATNEQVLQALAPVSPIVQEILDYREHTKLKSTYVETLPLTIHPSDSRIHTTFNQSVTATGRLQSQDPNLQNIPIRTTMGREIREAFTPRDAEHILFSADYSQIELRIIASLSADQAMIEDFNADRDIHAATASKVFGVDLNHVSDEMRRKSKMVNFGIVYGISPFGLAQRLGISRTEAKTLIDEYFKIYSGIERYMKTVVEQARKDGFVTTFLGRRRYLRDINSKNATQRAAAERNAINAPIQGSAADMIKLAMGAIHIDLEKEGLRSKMILQVHDELVFDVFRPEQERVQELVVDRMQTAMELKVPLKVQFGFGETWLQAH